MENKSYFSYEDIYCDETGVYWLFAYDFNGLFSFSDGGYSYVTSIDGYSFDSVCLFGAIAGIGNKIVLVPAKADHIVVFDKKTCRYEKYAILDIEEGYNENAKFFAVARYKEDFYLIGRCYPAIIKFNPYSGEQKYYYLASFDGFFGCKGKDIFRHNYCIKDNLLFIPCSYTNKVFVFNLETGEGKFLSIGAENMRYSGICYDGTRFWLSPLCGNVAVNWEFDTNDWNEVKLLTNETDGARISFVGCAFLKNNVYFIPANTSDLVLLDIGNHHQRKLNMLEKKLKVGPIKCYFVYRDELVCVSAYEGEHFKILTEKDEIILEPLKVKDSLQEIRALYKENFTDVSGPVLEKKFFEIEDLIDLLGDLKRKEVNSNTDETIGGSIWLKLNE